MQFILSLIKKTKIKTVDYIWDYKDIEILYDFKLVYNKTILKDDKGFIWLYKGCFKSFIYNNTPMYYLAGIDGFKGFNEVSKEELLNMKIINL